MVLVCTMPGTRIKDQDWSNIDPNYICQLCGLLLHQPVQSNCGHLFCQSCVENLLKYVNHVFLNISQFFISTMHLLHAD